MKSSRPVFAICVTNDNCDDLTVGMVYRVLPDDTAAEEEMMRIIDDSGEDYLYPAHRFVIVEVPQTEEPKLLAIASATSA
jgi:hypothetical protein